MGKILSSNPVFAVYVPAVLNSVTDAVVFTSENAVPVTVASLYIRNKTIEADMESTKPLYRASLICILFGFD